MLSAHGAVRSGVLRGGSVGAQPPCLDAPSPLGGRGTVDRDGSGTLDAAEVAGMFRNCSPAALPAGTASLGR
jgi:hypothetical protein